MPKVNKYYLLVFAFLFQVFSINAQRLQLEPFDVIDYQFKVELNDNNDQIKVNACIKIVYDEDIPPITVLDFANKKGRYGMEVSTYKINDQLVDFNHQSDQLIIQTPDGFQRGDTARLNISYGGIPNGGLIIARNSAGFRTFFAEHWPNNAHQWLPVIDHPAEKATCEFNVLAPSKYRVVSNGERQKEEKLTSGMTRAIWKMNDPISPKVMVIGVAQFDVNTIDGNEMIRSWTYKSSGRKSINKFSNSSSIFDFIYEYMGDYPFSKCDQVESTTRFGGMENAGNIFYPESSLIGDKSIDATIAHEIAHQWFGDAVTEASWADLWISEGFATYFENLWTEKAFGKDSLLSKLRMDETNIQDDQIKRPGLKVIQDDFSEMDKLMNFMTYDKGAWVLRALAQKVGDETFKDIVVAFYKKYKYKTASTTDFIVVASEISKKDLSSFFELWFYRSGNPKIGYQWNYKNRKLMIEFEQLSVDIYEVEVDVYLKDVNGSSKIHRITLSKRKQTFEIQSKEVVDLEVDPMNFVLGDIFEI